MAEYCSSYFRDIRIPSVHCFSDKDALPGYFGFKKSLFAEELHRTGEPIQFFVRQDATEESAFFKKNWNRGNFKPSTSNLTLRR